MNITYNYKVTRVDYSARIMEVEYSSDGHETMLIGMPIPLQGQSVEAAIKQYAPVSHWQIQSTPILQIQENTSGVIDMNRQVQPSPEELLNMMTELVQLYIDTPARSWGYDDAKTAVTYMGDPNPQFAAEAVAIRDFRSACWVRAWELRDEVEAGARQTPTKEELYAELPAAPVRPQA